MDIYDKYKNVVVRIVYHNGDWGSGCLFQPNAEAPTYVFTAKHCLMDGQGNPYSKNDIKVTRETGETLSILDIYMHRELDLALVTVERVEGVPSITIGVPSRYGNYAIYGYPQATAGVPSGQDEHGERRTPEPHRISVTMNFIEKNEIQLTSDVSLSTYRTDESGNVNGLSGAGVFRENGDDLVIIGVFTGFPGLSGAFSGLSSCRAERLEEIVQDNGLSALIPYYLSDFSLYMQDAFRHHEKKIELVLRRYAAQVKSVTPHEIVRLFGEKLFLPHGNGTQPMGNPKLWQGWLALLTYLCLESGIRTVSSDMNRVSHTGSSHRIRFYFSHEYSKLHDVVSHLIVKLNDEFSEDDRVLVNHSGPVGTPFLGRERIRKIVANIGQDLFYQREGFDIAQADVSKSISCIHIEYFTQKFSSHGDVEDMTELENRIKESISEVFDNAG